MPQDKRLHQSDFVGDPRVVEITTRANDAYANRLYSDVIDDAGHQYVDLVMEGGGVLGIALLGYVHVLEEAGLRFLNIGGTSAGSIAAMLLAGLGTRDQPKGMKIAEELANVDMNDFVDGGKMARLLLKELLGRRRVMRAAAYYVGARGAFLRALGFNPGDNFLKWMTEVLARDGVDSTRALVERMEVVPDGFRRRDGESIADPAKRARVGMITAEIGTSTKVELPKMAPLFWKTWEELTPAAYVRASMSVPFFFHPYRVDPIPGDGAARELWQQHVNFDGYLPGAAVFVDGGIMSNFPIDIFHRHGHVPTAPTFGVKLGTDKRTSTEIAHPAALGLAAFNSARHCLDYDFIKRNPDYRHLVSHIDTGDHHWLNFDLTAEAKIDLFRRGAEAADAFLATFQWDEYKKIRRGIAEGIRESDR
jgi:NTE family protein